MFISIVFKKDWTTDKLNTFRFKSCFSFFLFLIFNIFEKPMKDNKNKNMHVTYTKKRGKIGAD